jgi:hypothetical protein
VASVVGLLVLAEEHATALDGREGVVWSPSSIGTEAADNDGGAGTVRRGTVGRYLFRERIQS